MIPCLAMIVANSDDLAYAIEHNINPIHMADNVTLKTAPNKNFFQAYIIGGTFTLFVIEQTQPVFMQFQSTVNNLVIDFRANAEYELVYFATTVYVANFYDCTFNITFENTDKNSALFYDFRNSYIAGMQVYIDAPRFEVFFSVSQVTAKAMSLIAYKKHQKTCLALYKISNCDFHEVQLNLQLEGDNDVLIAPTLQNLTIRNAIFYVVTPESVLSVASTATDSQIVNVYLNGSLFELNAIDGVLLTNIRNFSTFTQFMYELGPEDRPNFWIRDSSLKLHVDFSNGSSITIDRSSSFIIYSLPLCGAEQFYYGLKCTADACDLLGDTCSGYGECFFYGYYYCGCEPGFDEYNACRECREAFIEIEGGCFEERNVSTHGTCWYQGDIVLCDCKDGFVDRFCDKKIGWYQGISAGMSLLCAAVVSIMGWLVYRSISWWKRERHESEDKIPLQI